MRVRHVHERVTLFTAGAALTHLMVSRLSYFMEVGGWRAVVAPFVLLSGVWVLLESFHPPRRQKKGKGQGRRPREVPEPTETELESMILRAARSEGPLSVEAAALATGLSLQAAGRMLARLEREGHANSEIDERGGLWWVFPGLARDPQLSNPSNRPEGSGAPRLSGAGSTPAGSVYP